MKSILFILGVILYIVAIKLCFSNNEKIAEIIYSFTPRRYSMRLYKIDLDSDAILSNQNFQYTPRFFDINDTNELKYFGLNCTPNSFGFTKEEADKLFPEEKYPNCSEVTGITKNFLHLNRKQDIIYMTCPDNSGEFLYGPYDKLTLPKIDDTIILVNSNNGPIYHRKVEFALGECKTDQRGFMHAVLEPAFNQEAYNHAINKKKDKAKPIIIYFLTIDSFTRKHLFRKLPKTVEFFNNLKATHPDIAVYDFKLHSIFGLNSIENQFPVLGLRTNF